jgi:hypothetical protein
MYMYTALCIMFWMRSYPLLKQVGGGWAEFLKELVRTNATVASPSCSGGDCRFLAYIPFMMEKSALAGEGGGGERPSPFNLLPSRTKLQCTLQLRGQVRCPHFISTLYVLGDCTGRVVDPDLDFFDQVVFGSGSDLMAKECVPGYVFD